MADTFTFTNLPSNTIPLKNGKEGSVRVTVTNVSGRALEAMTSIELTPPNPLVKGWIRVEPAATTPMKRDGTTHFSVFVAVPEKQPAGSASFKLVVADEFNPHEAFNASPDVAFSWSEDGGGKPNYKWPLLIAAAMAVLVIVVIGLFVVFGSGDPTPYLELLVDRPIYGVPDKSVTPSSELASGEKVAILQRISGENWFFVQMENETPMWLEAANDQIVQTGDKAKITPYARATLTPTHSPVPPTPITPTDVPTITPTETPTSTATSTPTNTATSTATNTATPEQRALIVPFQLRTNTVDYYLELTEPGAIRIQPHWNSSVDVVISIMDRGGRVLGNTWSSPGSDSVLEYVVDQEQWDYDKIWRVNIENLDSNQTDLVDISFTYPNGSINGETFRDQFYLRYGAATANIVMALSQPGTIDAQVNWGSGAENTQTLIRVPLQGELSMATESRANVSYDVNDFSSGNLWIVSLMHGVFEPVSGTASLRYP